MKQHFVLGTAGHIDHGKTTLVKALTHMDTDRLIEEKQRGMTIDLGFAFFGNNVTIIDVPGHEKFIRNMVAGVSSIDGVLFVIAADDGIMPQTIEHLEILKLLQIKQGIVVITKIDTVEEEWIDLVEEEIGELTQDSFLANAPVVRVSGSTGKGVPELKQKINDMLKTIPLRQDRGIFRLPIDRVFTMKGFGTVVAGTVLSGSVKIEQTVELLPLRKKYRIRGLQQHGKAVSEVFTGDRAAINLAGIEKDQLSRGDILAEPGLYQPSFFFDVKLYLLKSAPAELKYNTRIRLHMGTSEIIARVRLLDVNSLKPGSEAYAQLHCEAPTVAENRDRFVIRRYSPLQTIGGGMILQTNPPRHKRFDKETLAKLKILESGDLTDIVAQAILKDKAIFINQETLLTITKLPVKDLLPVIETLQTNGIIKSVNRKNKEFYAHFSQWRQLEQEIVEKIKQYHFQHPLKQGITANEILSRLTVKLEYSFLHKMLRELESQGKIQIDSEKVRLADYQIELNAEQKQLSQEIETLFLNEAFTPPSLDTIKGRFKSHPREFDKLIAYLIEQKKLVPISDDYILHQHWLNQAREMVIEHFKQEEELSISKFRDYINASRKYALPLLNYFDHQGLTLRREDKRILNDTFAGQKF